MSRKTGNRWSNWAWDKPVKAFIWRSSRICRPIGGLPPWFFEDSLPHLLLRNNSSVITLKPLACAGLWVEVDKENPLPLLDKSAREADRCGRLPYPTFVIHNCDGFHQEFPFY